MDFCTVINEIKQKREEFCKILVSFVLTDSILFVEKDLLNQDCGKSIIDAVNVANGILNTEYEISNGVDVLPINQLQSEKIEKYLKSISLEKFCVIYLVAIELRSVLLGVLFVEEKFDVNKIFELAFFEELYEQIKWGVVDEITQRHLQIKNILDETKGFCIERGLHKN
jgi:chaperone required for assembly of F1-ATPase